MVRRFTSRTARGTGVGSAFAQLVTPGALDRLAGFVADYFRYRNVEVWVDTWEIDDDWEDQSEEEEEPQVGDPMEELDQTEIVQLVRREGLEGVGIDFRGMEVDTALAIIFRAGMQIMLEDMIEFNDDSDGYDD